MKRIHWLFAPVATLMVAAGCATSPTPKTIAATIAATPQLSTLNTLVQEAGLIDMLAGPGPITVFAPTDEAFKAVPPATMQALAKDRDRLKSVLTYHVVPGAVTATDVKAGPVKSVQGASLVLAKSGPFVTVEDAVLTTPDVSASNGVIHIVDKVLLPPTR